MAGGAIVGALRYLVEVDGAEAAGAKIDAFLADNEAKMKAAGTDVVMRVMGDISDVDRKIAEVEALKSKVEKDKAEVPLGADTSEFDKQIMAMKAELKSMEQNRTQLKVELEGAAAVVGELEAIKRLQNDVNKSTAVNTKGQLQQAVAVAKLRESYNKLASEVTRLENIKPAARRTEGERLTLARMRNEMSLMEHEGQRLGANLHTITQDLEGGTSGWRKWTRAMSSAHINMGPFSTTIKGLGAALVGLGPVLMGLVGSASALVGAVGAGLVGAFGVAAGAVTGLGLAMIPLLPSLKALFAEAKGAPSVGQAMAKMRDSLTGGIRKPFFQDAHQAVKTMQADFPMFQRSAEGAFKAVSTGFQGWMRGMRTPEAQHILSNLMGNFTKDIGPVMSGLGSLGTAFGRFISLASNAGPGISNTFQSWAQGIENATGKGSGFAAKVQDLVDKAKTLGSFLSATGRLATTFFSAGANSGQQMLETMTRAENRWTSWMKSVQGQQSLHQFFSDAVNNTTALFHAIAPLARTFTALSTALLPLTTGILQGATYITKFVQAVASIPGMLPLIHGLGVAIAGAFVVTKIAGWLGLFSKVGSILGITAAATTAETAAVAANTVAIEANTAAMAANAGAAGLAAGEMAGLVAAEEGAGAAAVTSGGAMAGMEASAAGLGIGLAAAFTLPVAAAIGLTLILGKTDHTIQDYHDRLAASGAAAQKTAAATKVYSAALAEANKLADNGKTRTEGYRTAVVKSRDAEARRTVALQEQQTAQANLRKSLADLRQAQTLVNNSTKDGNGLLRGGATPLVLAQKTVTALAGAYDQFHLSQINVARTTQGLSPILQSQATLFGILRKQIGAKLTAKIGVSGTAQQASQIARLSSQLQSFASKKAVAKILVSDEGAKAKIQDLQNLLNKTDHPHHTKVTASTNKGQVDAYLNAAAKADRSHTTHIRADTGQALSAVQQMQAAVDALHGKTITNYVNNVIRHGANTGAYMGGIMAFASGGMMQRAQERADQHAWKNSRAGARIRQPTYITGEEPGRTEYIITDNPAYRTSNLHYLQEAARALGAAVIPGYKKGAAHASGGGGGHGGGHGHGHGHGHGGGGPQTYGDTLDDKTGPGTPYDLAEKQVSYAAGLVDLENRRLTLGQSTSGSVISLIEQEIGAYGSLAGIISGIVGSRAAHGVNVPDRPKRPKGKMTDKEKKQYDQSVQVWQNSVSNAQDHNSSARSGVSDLADELRTINDITIPGLRLDEADATRQEQTQLSAQNQSFNAVSMDIFRSFSSNISGIIGQTFGGAVKGISASSVNANPVGTTIMGSSGTGVGASNTFPSSPTNGVNITNNFAGPPADPFTWTQQQAFEVQAA